MILLVQLLSEELIGTFDRERRPNHYHQELGKVSSLHEKILLYSLKVFYSHLCS